jgi:2-oxoglutarate ferredoxin oxidoreductase subunit alpha
MQKAFNMADLYQTVVIVMSDQHLADSYWTIESLDPFRTKTVRSIISDDEVTGDYKRYRITDTGISPRALPGQAGKAVVVTDSDEHDEGGHIIEDSAARIAMADKRMRKVNGISSDISIPKMYGMDSPELLLIGWGSVYGALKEAVDTLNSRGYHSSMLHISELWPFPGEIAESLRSSNNCFTVENNSTGQLRRLIRMETGIECAGSIIKYDGRPLTPVDIIREVENAGS